MDDVIVMGPVEGRRSVVEWELPFPFPLHDYLISPAPFDDMINDEGAGD